MLNSAVVRIVDFCAHRCRLVLIVGFFLTITAATYDVTRFSITTDTQSLISQDLQWHQRQSALSKAFPQQGISVVVTASTPENAEQATNALQRDLSKRSNLFRTVVQPDSGDFFQRSGLLFEPLPDVKKSIDGLSKAQFNHLGYFIRRAQQWIFRDVNSRLAHLRLDVIRYSILEMVSANPGISQISLSGALGIERARLVALLDELQKLHFITRQRSTTDRRSHALQLTSEGRAAVKEANHLIAAHEEKVIERIGPDAYPLLLAALSTFRSG